MPLNEPNGSYLSEQQIRTLLQPVHPSRVAHANGLSNMEAYEIRAHLNRIFGFARWSAETLTMECLGTQQTKTGGGKDAVSVGYRAQVRLTVCAPNGRTLATYTEWATGDWKMPVNMWADAHDMAIKTAESQALKRCAVNLGDQFGLSLYAKGSLNPLVRGTWVGLSEPEEVKEHEQVVAESDPDAHSEPADTPQTPSQEQGGASVQSELLQPRQTAADKLRAAVSQLPDPQSFIQSLAGEGIDPALTPEQYSDAEMATAVGLVRNLLGGTAVASEYMEG